MHHRTERDLRQSVEFQVNPEVSASRWKPIQKPVALSAEQNKSSYFWDKLHSLSGIVPIGAFLIEHFFENSYALVSPEKFNYVASKLEINGVFQFLNKWGIAVTPRAQHTAGWLGFLVGLALTVVGLLIVTGFAIGWQPFHGYL